MKKILESKIVTLIFITFMLIISQHASADRVAPTDRNTQVAEFFDKQSPPSQVDIWVNESGGYDESNRNLWGRNALLCSSSGNYLSGGCPNSINGQGRQGNSSISLQFTEKRSKLNVVLNLSGFHIMNWSDGGADCLFDSKYQLYSTIMLNCNQIAQDETLFSVHLPQSEIKKLPVGGVWEAHLSTKLVRWDSYYGTKVATWNADITLNMSDTSNQAIYFPSFGAGQGKDAQPHIDLNLRPLPGGDRQILGRLSGSTSLDMCLYDGYGSNSRQFQVQLSEPPEYPENPEGRQAGKFSVYNDIGNRNEVSNRIDYGVKMYFPESNSFQDVVNGETYTLPNINTDDIRAVRLASNISNVVLCVPTPLQINTPAFNIVDKTNGHYTGKIRVVFTPSLW